MSLRTPRCVCLTGPTACGKSELALELAERLSLEIVSMDSALVYRGMDIGTAKPAADVRVSVPHHLIDILDPAETYSAGRFRSDALRAIEAIESRGRLPLVVGGTLLYLRALRDGLAPLPGRDAAVRASLDAEAAKHGWPALHRRLESLDPDAAVRIAPNDRQRIQRALEVHALTGEPMTALQRLAGSAASPQMLTIALVPAERAELAERIERRFDAMVESGFVAEVERLKSRGDLGPDTPSMPIGRLPADLALSRRRIRVAGSPGASGCRDAPVGEAPVHVASIRAERGSGLGLSRHNCPVAFPVESKPTWAMISGPCANICRSWLTLSAVSGNNVGARFQDAR